jgi:hypothetical protein
MSSTGCVVFISFLLLLFAFAFWNIFSEGGKALSLIVVVVSVAVVVVCVVVFVCFCGL